MLDEAARYSRQELFELWKSFRHDPRSVVMLADFSLLGRYQAQQLSLEFWREIDIAPGENPVYPQAKHNDSDFEW